MFVIQLLHIEVPMSIIFCCMSVSSRSLNSTQCIGLTFTITEENWNEFVEELNHQVPCVLLVLLLLLRKLDHL